jgi:hypothetical protein
MLRYFLQALGIPNVDDFALTAAEAAIAAALLRAVVLPLLQKASFWEKIPKSVQLMLLALIASIGAALDHFAGGNETRSSVITGVMAFLGALGLEKGQNLVRDKKALKAEREENNE